MKMNLLMVITLTVMMSGGTRVEVNNDNTDTENSDYENESESDSNDIGPILQNKYFIGKDNTRWNKNASITVHRPRSHNIITLLPGPKTAVKNLKTHLEFFFLFFDEVVISIIVKNTNTKMASEREKYERAETYDVEIKALIGILIFVGFKKCGRRNLMIQKELDLRLFI